LEATVHRPNGQILEVFSSWSPHASQDISTWALPFTCWPPNPTLHLILALFWPKMAFIYASSRPVWSLFWPPKGCHQVGSSFCSPTCTQLVLTHALQLICWPPNPTLHLILALSWAKVAFISASSWPVWTPFWPRKGCHQVGISFCSPTCTQLVLTQALQPTC